MYVEYHGQIIDGVVLDYSMHSTNADTPTVYISAVESVYKEYYIDDIFHSKEEAEQTLKGR